MLFNKNEVRKASEKKVLHKSGKNWIVLSSALLLALAGGAAVSSQTSANADNTNQQNVQENEQDFLNQVDNNSNINNNNNATIHSLVGNDLVNAPASASATKKTSAKQSTSASSQWYWKWNGGSAQSNYANASSEANLASDANKTVNSYVKSVNAKFPSATSSLDASLGNAKSVLSNDKSLAASYSDVANNSNYSSEVNSLAHSAGMTNSAYIQSVEYVAGSYNSAVKNDSVLNSEMTSVNSYAGVLTSIAGGNAAVHAEYSNAADSATNSAVQASLVYSNAVQALNAYNANSNSAKDLNLAEKVALNDSVEDAGTVQSIANEMGISSSAVSSEVRNLAVNNALHNWTTATVDHAGNFQNVWAVSGAGSVSDSAGKSLVASFASNHYVTNIKADSYSGTTTDTVQFDYLVNNDIQANGNRVPFTKGNGATSYVDNTDPAFIRVVSNTAVMYNYDNNKAAYGKNAQYASASSAVNSASVAYADAQTTANYYDILASAAATNNPDDALNFIFGTNGYTKSLMDPATNHGANAGEAALDNLGGVRNTGHHVVNTNVGIKNGVNPASLEESLLGEDVISNADFGSLTSADQKAVNSAADNDFNFAFGTTASASSVINALSSVASDDEFKSLNSNVQSGVYNALYGDFNGSLDATSNGGNFGNISAAFSGVNLANASGMNNLSMKANTRNSLSAEVSNVHSFFNSISNASNVYTTSASMDSAFNANSTMAYDAANTLNVLNKDTNRNNVLANSGSASDVVKHNIQLNENYLANANEVGHALADAANEGKLTTGVSAAASNAALSNFQIHVTNGNDLANTLRAVENDPRFSSLTSPADTDVINALNNDFTGTNNVNDYTTPEYNGDFTDGEINSAASSAASAYTVESNASVAYGKTTDANIALAPYYAASYEGDIKPDQEAVNTASNARENFYVAHAGSAYASAEYTASSASNAADNDSALAQAYGINVYNNTPKYIRAIRGVQVHSDTNFGSKSDKRVGSIKAGQEMTVEGIGLDVHGALRYNIYYHGNNYFVSGNDNYVKPTFLPAQNNVSIVVNKPVKEYVDANFTKSAGKTLNTNAQVSGDVVRMDNFNNGFTRVHLSNGNYISANTNYVAVVANNDDQQNNINGQNINHYINNANNNNNNHDAPITWGI